MSGGLDSSYAALKLKEAGHTVEGACLVMHGYTDTDSAARAAEKLGIPLHIIDCRELFDKEVVENLVSEYKRARTPNPCIVCNPKVKFSELLRAADEGGFDAIATGHYARIARLTSGGGEYHAVMKALDAEKDQSYMLYRLPERILARLILPLGDECKSDIRRRIRGGEFSSFDKKDSQEICFIQGGDHAAYIEARSGPGEPGLFVDKDGNTLGEHKGIIRYTVGQRKGLGISLGERAFITKIDAESNRITLESAPLLLDTLKLSDVVLTGGAEKCFRAEVKIRYAARPAPASVRILDGGGAEVRFDDLQRSVTPGQSAVFYLGDTVVGGGIIV